MVAEETINETRGAVRFFWTWLFLATTVSVAGNVAHAVLTAPPGTVRLAAAAAVVTGKQRYQYSPNSCSPRRVLRSRPRVKTRALVRRPSVLVPAHPTPT